GGPGAVIFNQNFHPRWRSSAAAVTRNRRGNLALRLSAPVPPGTTISLRFRDESSMLGRQISRISAYVFLLASGLLLVFAVADWRRAGAAPTMAPVKQLSRAS